MTYVRHAPRPPLGEYLQGIWYFEGGQTAYTRERVLPHGAMQLVIDLDDDRLEVFDPPDLARPRRFRGPLLCGPHTGHFVIDSPGRRSILGVLFRPDGAAPFLGLPAGEVRDRHVPLEAIWGPASARLRERLHEAPTLPDRFRIVEDALLARAASRLRRQAAVAHALPEFDTVPHVRAVGQVTEAVGLTPKRFIQVFRDEVGLTPKVFCRIRRFQAALRCTSAGGRVEWADVAAACGYFDQAHCSRDFRAFSGLSPGAYLVQRSEL